MTRTQTAQIQDRAPCMPADEDQVKTITLNYPEFCLLIELVAAQVGSDRDSSGEWTNFYARLGGSQ